MESSFTLKINSNEGDSALLKGAFICENRQVILEQVSSLGGTVITNFEVSMYNTESFLSIIRFIGMLQANNFAIKLNGKVVCWVAKTPDMKKSWKYIRHKAKKCNGSITDDGDFDFDSQASVTSFMNLLI